MLILAASLGPLRRRMPFKPFSAATIELMPEFQDIKTWTEHLGHSRLRSFTDEEGHFWLEQNSAKTSKWAKLAREGHQVAWEFVAAGGSYAGRVLIDGGTYTTAEATKKFLQGS
jgi:hypothetical protein